MQGKFSNGLMKQISVVMQNGMYSLAVVVASPGA